MRDNGAGWKKEAVLISNEIRQALTPILGKALNAGLTYEDFFYLAATEADSIAGMDAIEKRRRQRGGSADLEAPAAAPQ